MPDPRQQDHSFGESGLILLLKLIILTINIYLFTHRLKLGKSLHTCCFNFFSLRLTFKERVIREQNYHY